MRIVQTGGSQLLLADDHLVLDFPYDAAQVTEVKRIPGAKWDRVSRVWRLPLESLEPAREFAGRHAFHVDPSVNRFTLPKPIAPVTPGKGRLVLDGDRILLEFRYDALVAGQARKLPSTTWDQKLKRFTTPVAAVTPVVEFARRFGLDVPDDIELLERDRTDAARRRLELSSALAGDIDVPGITGMKSYQRAGVEYILDTRRTFLADDPGTGKAQPLDAPVLTPAGWRPIGELRVGDPVIGRDGSAYAVTGVFPQGVRPMRRVTFSDGVTVECDVDHLWAVNTRVRRRRSSPWMVKSTAELESDLVEKNDGHSKWFVPVAEPVRHPTADLPLDPYLMGVLLGDGCFRQGTPTVCLPDAEVKERVAALIPAGTTLSAASDIDYRISTGSRNNRNPNPVKTILSELGLWGHLSLDKFIPDMYLHADIEQRTALLAGLMDTDGTVNKRSGVASYSSGSLALAEGVAALVRSLGGVARVRPSHGKYWNVNVSLHFNPFRLARKAGRYKAKVKYFPARAIRSIEPADAVEAVCISVSAPDRLYLTTGYTVTHNTLQTIAALEAAHQQGVTAWPAVVVCPATLVLNWPRELDKWLAGKKWKVIQGRKDPGDLSGFDMVVVGWPNLSAHVERLAGFSSYVFDESHAAKNYDAQRTRAAIKVARHAPGLVLCLTGTPVTNRPAEFASQLEILGRLHDFGDRWSFYKRYCGAYQDKFKQWHIDGASNLQELNDRLRGSCYVRRTKAQVMPELDPVQEVVRLVTPDPKVMVEYRKAEADIVEYVARRAYELALELGERPGSAAVRARLKAEANEHLVRLAALRRLAALSKTDAVVELVEEIVDSGRKVILAAHHRDVVDNLASRWNAVKIQGGMSPAEVEEAKARFQNEPLESCPVIVLSIMAAKEGHTLTASSDVVFVEEPWTPADVDQVVARAHRLGQRDSVTAWHLLAAGTVDERVHALIGSKREVVTAAVDGGDPVRAGDSVGVTLLLELAGRGR